MIDEERRREEEKSLQKKNKEEKALDIQVKTGENGTFFSKPYTTRLML